MAWQAGPAAAPEAATLMNRALVLLLTAVCAAGWLGCGGGEDSPSSHAGVLGQGSVPIPAATPDPGILGDATQYQPAKPPAGSGPAAKAGGSVSARPEAGAAEVIQFLVAAIRDMEADLALKAFEPDQVAVLTKDKLDPIYATLELVGEIAKELDETVINKVLGGLRGAAEGPKVDTLDAQNASATPNVARVLFGPKAGGDALKLKKGPQGWKVQLEAPLTDADVAAIEAFHKALQGALNQMLDYARATKPLDEARLTEAAAKALRGDAIDLPVAAGEKDALAPADKPSDARDEERRP